MTTAGDAMIAIRIECGRCGKRLGTTRVPSSDRGLLADADAVMDSCTGAVVVANRKALRWSVKAKCKRCGTDWRREVVALATEARASGQARVVLSAG